MSNRSMADRFLITASLFVVAACQESPTTTMQPGSAQFAASPQLSASPQALAAAFNRATPEVMALPQTVFGGRDEASGQLVFGVEHPGVAVAVRNVMERLGYSTEAYRVEVAEPIRFASTTLRTAHRPTMGGLQIHFSSYLCTLGFNADHGGGRSFFTNSHCTNNQGQNSGTVYYQPASNVDSNPIGTEAHDPAYSKFPGCSRNKNCRYSDAARVLYSSSVGSLGNIAKTAAVNSGSLDVSGHFDVTSQDVTSTHLSGTLHKVGRTTGWTSGQAAQTCVTVNVSGSNIQLHCQTLVTNSGATIVGSGDSGSPVFKDTGSGTAQLVGILWGSSGGNTFVFSPLSGLIADGLGAFNATTDYLPGPAPTPEVGSITGTVTDGADGSGISGATVSVNGTALFATTNGSGEYTISNVPADTYSVTASANGYLSKTVNGVSVTANASTTANFTLESEPVSDPGGTVRVSSVGYSTSGGRLNDRHLTVTVSLIDDTNAPVSGASVAIRLDRNGSQYATVSGTTGSSGSVSFSFSNAPSGTFTTVVQNVVASGLEWDGNTPPNGISK